MKIKLGTRSSQLAMRQANLVKSLIAQNLEWDVEIVSSSSIGDKDLKSRLTRFRGQGVFTSGLELQLLDNDIDIAVHSLKDLPVEDNEGLHTIAFLDRHNSSDSVIIKEELLESTQPLKFKQGIRFATGSPRRQSQFMQYEPTAIPIDIRGNVETRLSRLNTKSIDAVIMASAVFERINLQLPNNTIRIELPRENFPSAPGQGVIAVQVRSGEFEELASLDDSITRSAATAERKILAQAGGGCELSLGVNIIKQGKKWHVQATKAIDNWDASQAPNLRNYSNLKSNIEDIETEMLQWLKEETSIPKNNLLKNKTVFIARSNDKARPYKAILQNLGASVINQPLYHFFTLFDQLSNEELIESWNKAEWLVISSQRTEDFLKLFTLSHDKPIRIAVTGPKTAAMIRSLDLPVHLISHSGMRGVQELLNEAFEFHPGSVLYLRGTNFHDLPTDNCDHFPVYNTEDVQVSIPTELDYLVVFSKRSAQVLIDKFGRNCTKTWVAIGDTTGQWLKDQGIAVRIARHPTPEGIATAINTN